MIIKKSSWFIALLMLVSIFSYAAEKDDTSNSQKLRKVEQQIAAAKKSLRSKTQHQNQLQEKLKRTEVQIGKINYQIIELDRKISSQQKELNTLNQQAISYRKQLVDQQQLLQRQLRGAYESQQTNFLKLLFNEDNLNDLSRMSYYYYYFNQARLDVIKTIATTLDSLNQTEEKIKKATEQLSNSRAQYVNQQSKVKLEQDNRKITLKDLKQEVETEQQKLEQLVADKKRLNNLLQQLDRSSPAIISTKTPFAQLKSKLPWPTNGTIIRSFGSRSSLQSLPSNGVFIKAPEGREIRAIAPGKVVFADWLRGFGLLLIVDHGKGYMSLYAYCNTLLKKSGDIVAMNTPIATVGNSGGQNETGLYFEIRAQGYAQNPIKWCRGKP